MRHKIKDMTQATSWKNKKRTI